ncbi:hypothetical protein GCM10011317_51600 [Niveispirillum cyanobacteriorum]|nr:hypothetical protein GCM10011317_51600 [Niveispirillum cyanobacteriorum]
MDVGGVQEAHGGATGREQVCKTYPVQTIPCNQVKQKTMGRFTEPAPFPLRKPAAANAGRPDDTADKEIVAKDG